MYRTFATFAATILAISAFAQAESIGIQFYQASENNALLTTESAGVVAQDHWNALSGSSFTDAALTDNAGSPTTAVLNGSGAGSYWCGNGGFPAGGDKKLARTALLALYGNPVTYTVSSIPYASYDLYVYGTCDGSGNTITFQAASSSPTAYRSFITQNDATGWTEGLSTWNGVGPVPGDVAPADYVHFTGMTGGTFSLTYFAIGNAGINGIQIVQTAPVPEPAGLGLIGLGAATLLSTRRRKA